MKAVVDMHFDMFTWCYSTWGHSPVADVCISPAANVGLNCCQVPKSLDFEWLINLYQWTGIEIAGYQ